MTDKLLKDGESVIFDTNFNFYRDRQYLRRIAEDHGATTKLIWIKTPKEIAKQRATHLGQAERNTYAKAMPAARFGRISADLEEPKGDETFIKLDGTKITKTAVKKALDS